MRRWSRRRFLRSLPLGAAGLWSGGALWRGDSLPEPPWRERIPPPPASPRHRDAGPAAAGPPSDPAAETGPPDKTRDFERDYADDLFVSADRLERLVSLAARLERVRDTVGFGRFNLVSFEEMLRFARRYPAIGAFPRPELALLEELFHADATSYGFRGDKVFTDLTAEIRSDRVRKVAGSGHYLLRGRPLEKFQRMRRDLGESLVLTSGVRGMAKQFQLFLTKAVAVGGNLSRASRSLAPPGYSYHATGDFDVGKAGFGLDNFTETFCETDEYRRLIDLGYVSIRYFESNPFGVRHEPWHIKVA